MLSSTHCAGGIHRHLLVTYSLCWSAAFLVGHMPKDQLHLKTCFPAMPLQGIQTYIFSHGNLNGQCRTSYFCTTTLLLTNRIQGAHTHWFIHLI